MKCELCQYPIRSGRLCGWCRHKLKTADQLAPPGTGCALGVILMCVFWVTLAVCLWIVL